MTVDRRRPGPARSSATLRGNRTVTSRRRSAPSTAIARVRSGTTPDRSHSVRATHVTGMPERDVTCAGPTTALSCTMTPSISAGRVPKSVISNTSAAKSGSSNSAAAARNDAHAAAPAVSATARRSCCHVSGAPAARYAPRRTGSSLRSRSPCWSYPRVSTPSASRFVTRPCCLRATTASGSSVFFMAFVMAASSRAHMTPTAEHLGLRIRT